MQNSSYCSVRYLFQYVKLFVSVAKLVLTENMSKSVIFFLNKNEAGCKDVSFLKAAICLKPIPKIITRIFCFNNCLLLEEWVRYD